MSTRVFKLLKFVAEKFMDWPAKKILAITAMIALPVAGIVLVLLFANKDVVSLILTGLGCLGAGAGITYGACKPSSHQ